LQPEAPSESTNATILIVTNQGSLFTFEAMMNFDKITRELTEADVLLNRSSFYLIKTNGESTEHYETIGSDAWFKENLNHNWKLIKQDTIISGYVCKKATVNYAGRLEYMVQPRHIITVGPYKFHGLSW
jgi:GLPGLI family protein